MPNFISEDQIERALVQKLQHLHGFDSLNCHTEDPEDLNDGSGRANKRDVILVDRVREAAIRLNPDIPAKAIDDALEKLLDRRQAMSLVAANQEIYNLLRDGIPVEFDNAKGQKQQERVRLIDFNQPDENRYLAVTQLWVKGERGFRRPDVLLYVNGIPLGLHRVEELKREAQERATTTTSTNYKHGDSAACISPTPSACSRTPSKPRSAASPRNGSISFNWLRAEDEKEKIDREEIQKKGTSLEGVIAGLFPADSVVGLRRELHPLLQREREDHRAEPSVHRREPRIRDAFSIARN